MSDPLPGGVGLSRLCVYDTVTPDGRPGGTPHLHLCCTEAYVVTAGKGAVQTLSGNGFAEHELVPGTVLWFTPGTVHRLINLGGLDIVVVMANSGLPEAGDAVFTFPPEVLRDPERYATAATLPGGGAPGTDVGTAYTRRDLAIEGFMQLREAVERDGPRAMAQLYEAAVALKRPLLDAWRNRWENGAFRVAQLTGVHLDALGRGDPGHLRDARVHAIAQPSERGRLGMCGLLDTYLPPVEE
ncbi:cupin domain-containing protein [Actinophytocola sediminis]